MVFRVIKVNYLFFGQAAPVAAMNGSTHELFLYRQRTFVNHNILFR
jgi:hypothetical protein